MLQKPDQIALTPREREEFEQEKEAAAIQTAYNLQSKEMDVEIARIENRWTKLPMLLIKLPVFILFGIAFIIAVSANRELPKEFWRFLGIK